MRKMRMAVLASVLAGLLLLAALSASASAGLAGSKCAAIWVAVPLIPANGDAKHFMVEIESVGRETV